MKSRPENPLESHIWSTMESEMWARVGRQIGSTPFELAMRLSSSVKLSANLFATEIRAEIYNNYLNNIEAN